MWISTLHIACDNKTLTSQTQRSDEWVEGDEVGELGGETRH